MRQHSMQQPPQKHKQSGGEFSGPVSQELGDVILRTFLSLDDSPVAPMSGRPLGEGLLLPGEEALLQVSSLLLNRSAQRGPRGSGGGDWGGESDGGGDQQGQTPTRVSVEDAKIYFTPENRDVALSAVDQVW